MLFILVSAIATFCGMYMLLKHPSRLMKRRVLGYIGWFDLLLHGTIIMMFMGNAAALVAAELAGIGLSLYLRGMRSEIGLQRFERRGMSFVWVSYSLKEWQAKCAEAEASAERHSEERLAKAAAPRAPRASRKAAVKPAAKRKPAVKMVARKVVRS